MIELHALLEGKKRDVRIPEFLNNLFSAYKELASKEGVKDFNIESFCAGYLIGTNFHLREGFLMESRNIKIRRGDFDEINFN